VAADFVPIIYWITQDSYSSYDESRQEILRTFRPFAKALLLRHAPPERSGCQPETLIYLALFSLQQKIFDQYLPKLERSRLRSIGCIWPSWQRGGMKILLENGMIHNLMPLPEGNGALQHLDADGCRYAFKFYRNDSLSQRQKWLHRVLKDAAQDEERALGRKTEIQLEEGAEFVDNQTDRSPGGCTQEWRAITDRDDWKACLRKAPGDPPAERKKRQRAKCRLLAAYNILCHPLRSGASKTYLERLRKTRDGERKPLLDDYLRRYPEEFGLKTRG
jgi:hypothetical protein